MKRVLLTLLLLVPLAVTGAIQQYRMEWNPLPSDQVVLGECSINGGAYTSVGNSPGTGSITFSLDVNPGDSIHCRAWTTKQGFPDSARSEVAQVLVPLAPPQGVRVLAAPL
jgi:hypothetical protein